MILRNKRKQNTHMMNKQDFLDRFNAPNFLKPVFEEYIKNRTIPLADRWEVFLAAPHDLSNHESFIHQFNIEDEVGEISWFDDFYYDNYCVIKMHNVIDKIIDEINHDRQVRLKWTRELVDKFKEEILEQNIKSFENNW